MTRTALALVVALRAGWAFAQPVYPPPQCDQYPNDPRCQPSGGVYLSGGNIPVGGARPSNLPKAPVSAHGGGGGGGGLSGLDGKAALVLLAVTAVALPLIVYAMSDEADAATQTQHAQLHEDAQLWGGALNANDNAVGFTAVEGTVGKRWLGAAAGFESTLLSPEWRSARAGIVFRAPPQTHIDLAVELGFRWYRSKGVDRFDGEVALPHRYVLFRAWGQGGGIEVRPEVTVGGAGADVRVEAGLVLPLGPVAAFHLGGRFFTFDFQKVEVVGGGGVSATF